MIEVTIDWESRQTSFEMCVKTSKVWCRDDWSLQRPQQRTDETYHVDCGEEKISWLLLRTRRYQ